MPRALLSVFDKSGIQGFALELRALGFELLASGGTAEALAASGIDTISIADVTGFPELLGGRVKTLHPAIHGGILAGRESGHLDELARHDIVPIDLVAVNLYPFAQVAADEAAGEATVIENIDIGGPTLLRSAAKNFADVLAICDPEDYPAVIEALQAGGADRDLRLRLARKAFAHTAGYDAAIVQWFNRGEALPESIFFALEHAASLRYGENPHQGGARYREGGTTGWSDRAIQHSGIELSYLNLFDTDAAWRLVHELPAGAAAVIVKHANPCGVAVTGDIETAYRRAFDCDPKSAFGGIVALNSNVTPDLATAIRSNPKADVVIAPGYDDGAIETLTHKRKNLRVLEAPPPGAPSLDLRRIDGGVLVQTTDTVDIDRSGWRTVTKRQPTEAEWQDLQLAWVVCAHTKSNAVVMATAGQAVGIGAGQQSRVDACEIAARKSAGRARGGACASDAFFPFRDGVDVAAQAGVSAVIQPGGSLRDDEVIEAANQAGMAMVFTGKRHFRH